MGEVYQKGRHPWGCLGGSLVTTSEVSGGVCGGMALIHGLEGKEGLCWK